MKNLSKAALFSLALSLAGCAGFAGFGAPPVPGEPAAAVTAKMGRPSAVYQVGNETMLEYATGPLGQYTHMARIGSDGNLRSLEQVLTGKKFATIKIGVATRQDVLHTIGRPAKTSYLALPRLEVWSYRYKESGVWDSMMHVHFDRAGIVRMMQNGPDPSREERDGFFFR